MTQSNRIEELAVAIGDALPADPFARPTVVVSSRLVGRWLRYDLARRRGVAGHLHLPFLEPFLEEAFRADGLGGLDRARLGALVASALADGALLADPVMAPVRRYLDTDGADAADVRRVQLAERVAAHLWDYALTRPAWLDAWDEGRDADAGEVDAATLAWQRRIYDALFTGGLAGGRALIPRLPHARRRLGLPPPRLAGPVHVLGFSYLARAHVDALVALGAGDELVHVAMLSPCAEYWEDVPGRRAARGDEPLALVYWGGPGRDTTSMLLEATQGDVTERPVEPDAATVLGAWARDVLHRSPPTVDGAVDPAVSVLACPSVSRELEIVGSEIWRLLREDERLRATDVAVLIAGDAERYLAQVGPVFGSLHRLPFHVIDAPATQAGRVAEAALELVALPLGRFTRREMLSLMTHPSVLARHPHVDPADWVAWCARLGIAHGADGDDHRGTYLDGDDAFHWSQGIRRLAVGAFVAGEPLQVGACEMLPEAVAPDQQASAATFALLARSLIGDGRWLAGRRETLTRWAAILAAMVETYLDDADDGRARVVAELRGLADLDLDGRLVPYREVAERVRARLGALREGRGEPLAHGVRVAPLEPMRAIPAEVVFVVGLGEGLFPAGEHPPALDLRTQRKKGDVSSRDRDRYAFLEALLAARRRVVLSYVARDEQSGDPRAPSSLIHELAEMLAPYLGVDGAAEALAHLRVEHPLRRWDDRYQADPRLTPSASPAAARERHAVAVRAALDAHLADRGRAAPDAPRLRELLAEPALVDLRARLRLDLADGVPPPEDDDDAPVVLSLSVLRTFLETPVQAWAQVVLRLEGMDLDDDGAEREDEPFDVAARDRAATLREAFALTLAGAPVEEAYAQVRRRRELAGQAPLGPFGAAAARRDVAQLGRWREELREKQALDGPWQRLAFGRAGVRDARLEPAIVLDVEVRGRLRRIEIVGTTELVGGPGGVRSLMLAQNEVKDEHQLRPALDHVALTAAGVVEGERCAFLFGKKKLELHRLLPWTRDAARAHLATLAGDLLGGPHAYLLPLYTAKAALRGEIKRPQRSEHVPPLGWGPLDRDPGLAVPADAAAIAARRLAPLTTRMVKA